MESANHSTVFVIDDDADVRSSIQALLDLVGLSSEAFATPREFLDRVELRGPSCLILDVRLPGVSGLTFHEELSRAGIRIPVIFITAYGDIPMTVKALKSGAVEFLTKPFNDQVLLDAVQQALDRDRLSRAQQAQVGALRSRYESLTPREREVMRLVISGMLNKQVAFEIGTSLMNVKIHRSHLMAKMQAGSVAELARMAVELDVLPIRSDPRDG